MGLPIESEATAMPSGDDASLARAWAEGDQSAYEALIARHQTGVRARCRRDLPVDEAEDAVQQTFLVLHDRPAAAAASPQVGAWLQTVAANVVRNARRSRHRRQRAERAAGLDWLRHREVEDEADLDRLRVMLRHCLDDLPAVEREVVQRHYFAGQSYREIARGSSVALGTVAARMRRAVDHLRRDFARRGLPIGGALLTWLLRSRLEASVSPSPAVRATATVGAAVHSMWPAGSNWIMKTTAIAAAGLMMASATVFTIRGNGAEGATTTEAPQPLASLVEAPGADDEIVGQVMVVHAPDLGAAWDDFLASEIGRAVPASAVEGLPVSAVGELRGLIHVDFGRLPDGGPWARLAEIQRESRLSLDPEQLRVLTAESHALMLDREQPYAIGTGLDWRLSWDPEQAPGIGDWVAETAASLATGHRDAPQAGTDIVTVEATASGVDLTTLPGMFLHEHLALDSERGHAHGRSEVVVDPRILATPALAAPAADDAAIVLASFDCYRDASGALRYWETGRMRAWVGDRGLRLSSLNAYLSAEEAELHSATRSIDRAVLERIPESALGCVVLAAGAESPIASFGVGIIEGFIIGASTVAGLDARIEDLRASAYRILDELTAIDGEVLLYVDEQPMLPALSLVLPCAEASGQAILAAVADLIGHHLADGRLQVAFGPIQLAGGWVDGELRLTTHHLGLSAVEPPAVSLVDAPDVAAALATLPMTDESMLLLMRPGPITAYARPLVGMSGDQELVDILDRYRSGLDRAAPAHFMQVGTDDRGWRLEADGLIAGMSGLAMGLAGAGESVQAAQ